MSDYSIYPKAIDGYAQIPLAVDKRSPINAESVNRLRSGIINIEKAIGVAPEFSEEFGTFPDLASRINNLEGQFVADISLTGLYQRDNVLRLDEEPLVLSSPDGSFLDFGSSGENFIIASSTGLELEAKGTFSGPIAPEFPSVWPKSVVINKSETAPIDMGVPDPAHLTSYLSLGGEAHESDLAILKIDPPIGAPPEWGGMLGIFAGIKSALNDSVGPVSLNISVLDSEMPGANGGDLELSAGGSKYEDDRGGQVRIASGGHPLKRRSTIEVSGPEGGPHDLAGSVRLEAGGLINGAANGAQIMIEGSEDLSGGSVFISGGEGEDEGGRLDLYGGNGQNRGGDIYIRSGDSNHLVNVSNIVLEPGHNGGGTSGAVYINGNTQCGRNLSVAEDLNVSGSASLEWLNVGNTTQVSDLIVAGDLGCNVNVFINQDLTVGGDTSIQNADINQDANISQNLSVGGNTGIGQNLSVGDNTDVGQDLNVGGDTELGGGLVVSAATEMQGSLVVGDTTILEGITQINNLGGTAPLKDNVLVADDTDGTVKWASQSQYVSGIAFNPGTYGGGNIRQVIFTDPTSGVTTNGGCWIVPMDITIEKIFIKWVGDSTPTIAAGEDLTWTIGVLTDPNATTDTTGNVNFTDSTEDLSDLTVDAADSGTFFYKTASLNYDVFEGDILVLKHALATAAWSETSMDATVTIKYRQRWS